MEPLENYLLYFGRTANFNWTELFDGSAEAEDLEFERMCRDRVHPVGTQAWKDLLLPLELERRFGYVQLMKINLDTGLMLSLLHQVNLYRIIVLR